MLKRLVTLGVAVDIPEYEGEWTPLKLAAARVCLQFNSSTAKLSEN